MKFYKKSDLTINQIRSDARKVIQNRPRVCANCNYDMYVEVCHLKPIARFSKDSSLCDINSPENLAYLCPNCHKLLDTGKIQANPEWTVNWSEDLCYEDVFWTNL